MISVIVPALNEEVWIADCLRSLRDQTLPTGEYEVIVVDNGSLDDTVAVARQFVQQVHEFPGIPLAALRNRGAELARGDILAFIDADCVASPSWLSGARAALEEGGIAVGNKYDLPGTDRWIEALCLGPVAPGRTPTDELWSGNLVVKREAFVACGGFDPTFVSQEDIVLSHALRRAGSLYFDDRVRVVHWGGPTTVREFARQQMWHGFETWHLFRRGIARGLFAPTMTTLAGYGCVAVAPLLPSPARTGTALAGAALIGGAALVASVRHALESRPQGWLTAARLALLDTVSLSARAYAVVVRALGLHWSGRKTPSRAASN